jgi:hypothetical protein
VNNLKAAEYDGWADLALKQPDDKSSSQEFKTARHKAIEDADFTIIANVVLLAARLPTDKHTAL